MGINYFMSMKKWIMSVLFGCAGVMAAPLLAVAPLEGSRLPAAEREAFTGAVVQEWMRLGWVRVVERDRMDLVLSEQALQLSGVCGDACQVQAAQVLGARYLVVGQVNRVGQQYSLQLRLIDAMNGEVLATEGQGVRRTRQDLLSAVPGAVRGLAHQAEAWLLRGDPQEMVQRRAQMVAVPAGSFMMGSESSKSSRDEKPVHQVNIAAFYLDSTEVTQAAYRALTHRNPSRFVGCDQCPVENVTWHDAHSYCERLGKRLPTEAEWEYAARAGSGGEFFWGDSALGMESYVGPLTARSTYGVKSTGPNAWGLYEMAGNVSVWVWDWYHRDAYRWNMPKGPAEGTKRVQRGGHWYGNVRLYRVSRRAFADPHQQRAQVGFRCAMDAQELP